MHGHQFGDSEIFVQAGRMLDLGWLGLCLLFELAHYFGDEFAVVELLKKFLGFLISVAVDQILRGLHFEYSIQANSLQPNDEQRRREDDFPKTSTRLISIPQA